MMELGIAPDVEQLCIDAIDEVLPRIPEFKGIPGASTKILAATGKSPSEFVRLWMSNDYGETLVTDAPLVTVEGWADTETRAHRICSAAVAILKEQEGILFGVQKIGGVGNNPHPDYPDKARYSSLLQVRVRHEILTLD